MTLRGMVRISALGAVLLAAIAVASSVAHSQQPPQVSIDPRVKQDTVVALTPTGRAPLLFGFMRQVVDSAGLPVTVPARSFCVRARYDKNTNVVHVDSVVSPAEAELPACMPEDVPLVIRPECKLSWAENILWRMQKVRPVILFCGIPPEVYLLAKGEQ